MEFKEVFENVKPFLDSYIQIKLELDKQVSQEGILPDDIINECPIHSIEKVNKFDDKIVEATPNLVSWVLENKINWLETDTKNIYIRAENQKIEGKKGTRTMESMIISRPQGLKNNEKTEYEFKFALSNLKKKSFFDLLSHYKFERFFLCEHLDSSTISEAKPAVLKIKNVYDRYYFERNKTLGDALRKDEVENHLQLFCNDCYDRVDKVCCKDAIRKKGIGYALGYRHPPFENILFKLCLKKHDVNFKEYSNDDRFGRNISEFFLKDFNTLLVQNSRDIEKIVEKLKPETVIVQGKKQDIVDHLKFNTNLIIFNDSVDINQRFFLFDANKEVEQNIENCCLKIIQNLEDYSNEIRGKEHDKLIGALEKIGKELGYIPQREVASKGARVDLVWLDRGGSIFSALEVETTAQWKKDIVTTWETEPKLAVILAHYKSEKGVKDIIQYILLKNMPHNLLFINNITKKAYLIEKQNILKSYDIEKRKEIESEVFEY